jgi:hypothetical protein
VVGQQKGGQADDQIVTVFWGRGFWGHAPSVDAGLQGSQCCDLDNAGYKD